MTAAGRVRVVCAVITRGDTVLAARRPAGATNGGLWEFPGGKIRGGETPEEALEREIREELDVRIIPYESLPAVQWEYPWIAIELLPYICSLPENETPRQLDHAELRFVLRKQAARLKWSPADRVIVGQLSRG